MRACIRFGFGATQYFIRTNTRASLIPFYVGGIRKALFKFAFIHTQVRYLEYHRDLLIQISPERFCRLGLAITKSFHRRFREVTTSKHFGSHGAAIVEIV